MVDVKVILLFLSFYVVLSLQETVKVSVYYEALCPDSMNFIRKQLYPTYKRLYKHMDVDLVPYGKAIQNKVNGKWEFECQHGPKECFGNKVQACALKQNPSNDACIEFVYCVMSSQDPSKAGEKCANNVEGFSWSKILSCVNSEEGDNLLAHYGDRTHALEPKVTFVPTIIFNDHYNQTLMYRSLRNLYNVVCELLDNPDVCK